MINWRYIFVLLLIILAPVVGNIQRCQGQGDQSYVLPPGAAPAMDPHDIATKIDGTTPKTVVFVFDVTQSTTTGGVFEREREATATILRHGCSSGDHVVLIKFGTGNSTAFDATLSDTVSVDSLIDKIPPLVEPGAGTNIRWPHNEALKIIDADAPNPGVVVLLTDSYNDQPLKTDPNYLMYRAYYNLYKLTVYPNTPENRDYERLLKTLHREHRLHEYGVGVAIAHSGRPVERLPDSTVGTDAPEQPQNLAPTIITQSGHEKAGPNLAVAVGIPLLVVLILAGLAMAAFSQKAHVRLAFVGRSAVSDFRLKPGARVGLGGSPATAGPGVETFTISGLKEPVAYISGQFGGSAILKAAPSAGEIKVLHNGVKLDGELPIRVDDEIRIIIPAGALAEEQIIRLRIMDSKGSL